MTSMSALKEQEAYNEVMAVRDVVARFGESQDSAITTIIIQDLDEVLAPLEWRYIALKEMAIRASS